MFYSSCLVSAITSGLTFIFCSLNIGLFKDLFNDFLNNSFISELMEESEESEELSEVEEEHHDKPGEKPLSRSKTKNTFLKKRKGNKSITCTQCGVSHANQCLSVT